MMSVARWAAAGLGLMAAAVFAAPAQADVVVFDFTASGGSVSGSGFSTIRTYASGGLTLTARGYSSNGSGSGSEFSTAEVGQWGGAGLGVCNQGEGSGCGGGNHQVDNSGRYDLVLFQMNPAVEIASVYVQTWSGEDTDVSFYVGNAANPLNLAGYDYGDLGGLGFGSRQSDTSGSGGNTVTVDPAGSGTFNSLLLGALLGDGDRDSDAFKIRSMTITYNPPTTVPEPMTMALFGTGLVGLGLVARRRRRT